MLSTRWIGVGLSLFLAVALLDPGLLHADEIEEKKEDIKKRDKEIQRLEKEKEAAEKDLKSVVADLERKKKKLADRSREVYKLERKLSKTKGDLKKQEAQLKEQEERYKNRVRTIYEQGEMFYMKSLVEADSLAQFFNRLRFVKMVVDRDEHLIGKFRKDRSALAREEQKYERLLADRRKKKKAADQLHAQLIEQYKEYEKELDRMDEQQEHLEEVNEEERERIRDLVRKRQEEQATDRAPQHDGGAFLRPVKGASITSGYGMRYHPVRKRYKMHTGIDFGGSLGTPIYAAAGGKVIESRPATGYGYIIVIDHGGGISTLYAHVYAQDVEVKVGQSVSKGQRIAAVGNNGWSTGPHLHFEVLKDGEHTDPMPYLK